MTHKILFVEDNEFNLDMLVRRLTRRGYEILTAMNGKEAIEMAKHFQPHLILLDMNLPVMDGWEAAKILKKLNETKHIPIIALTAHTQEEEKEKALLAGCDEYEPKPIDFDRLLGKIQDTLELK